MAAQADDSAASASTAGAYLLLVGVPAAACSFAVAWPFPGSLADAWAYAFTYAAPGACTRALTYSAPGACASSALTRTVAFARAGTFADARP